MTATWAPLSFLATLTDATRTAALELGTTSTYRPGRRLVSEGERSDHVYIILAGFVKITGHAEGTETLLGIRLPGDVVGETAGLTRRPRMATVTTCGTVTAKVIANVAFQRFLTEQGQAAVSVAATMGERLRFANQRRTDFAAYPPEVRLARVFVDLAHRCGRPMGAGVALDIPLTQAELASMVGVAVPTIQRALRDLRTRGLVVTGYRHITMPDLEALQAAADAP